MIMVFLTKGAGNCDASTNLLILLPSSEVEGKEKFMLLESQRKILGLCKNRKRFYIAYLD